MDCRMRVYLTPKVLIIDEMSYLPPADLGATIFFRLMSATLRTGQHHPDLGLGRADATIATAILDRLLHHSHVMSIKGHSYRLRERTLAAASPQAAGMGPQ